MRLLDVWIPRLLFCLCLGAALTLAGGVLVCPWIVSPQSPALLILFAADATVRRVSLISATGLAVTAFVFFRGRTPAPSVKRPDPPRTMAGA